MSMTQAERLTRIEALLESGQAEQAKILAELTKITAELAADKADLAQLKNRGLGILIGIALVFAVIGAKAREIAASVIASLQ